MYVYICFKTGRKNRMAYIDIRESCKKGQKKKHDFRRVWVKEPRHSQHIFAKKRYTSIVACVGKKHLTSPKTADSEV